MVTPLVGVVAFAFIAHFLWQELKEMTNEGESNHHDDRQLLVSLGLILAVSWDALWSGPAKSAQVIGWPELLVWVSFLVVGMMVALCAVASLYLSKRFATTSKTMQHSAQHSQPSSTQGKVATRAQGIAIWLAIFHHRLFWLIGTASLHLRPEYCVVAGIDHCVANHVCQLRSGETIYVNQAL